MAELVEQSLALVEIEQRRLVASGFGEIAHHLDDGYHLFAFLVHFLSAELGHPCAAAFALTREEIHIQHAYHVARVFHQETACLLVVGGQSVGGLESKAVQTVGHVESAFKNVVEGEIGTYHGVFEVVFLGSQLFAVVTPVPRLQLGAGLVFFEHFLVLGAFGLGFVEGGFPYLHQTAVNGRRGLGQTVVEHIVGVGGETEDVGAFETQVGEGVDDFGIVELATVAAVGIGVPHLLAQLAVGTGLHERLPRGQLQGYLGAVVEFLAVGVGGFKHVLGETQGERGDALVEFAETCLFLLRHIGAAADEAFVCFLDQTHLFGVELQRLTLVVNGFDTGEELGVEGYVVAVGRKQRRNLFGDGLHLGGVFTFR